jgi:hypothetical protein
MARLTVLLTLSVLGFGAMSLSLAPVAHADSFALDILVPKPQSNIAEGPAGTNVTLSAQGGVAGHAYQLTYALSSCLAGGSLGSATADSGGNFTTTVTWPNGAAAVGSTYVICYKDTSQPLSVSQPSDQKFKVDAASPPAITLAQAPSSTPVANPPDGYFAGGPVQISGKNYYSNHVQLLAFYTLNQDFAPGDLQPGNALKQPNGGTGFTADANGAFTVVVTLPSITGNFFLHVVSNDGGGKYLPALVDTQPIKLVPKPAPSATAGATATPATATVTPTVDNGGGGGGSGNGVSAAGLVGVLSLGGLSILLFILGIYLLTSAGATPRNL